MKIATQGSNYLTLFFRMGYRVSLPILVSSLLMLSPPQPEAVTVSFDNLAAWEGAAMNIEVFLTTQTNVEMANGGLSLNGSNDKLPNPLTFDSSATGLSRSFDITAVQTGAQLVFNDRIGGDPTPAAPTWTNVLSVGNRDEHEDDNWEVNLLGGPALTAFGIDLVDNSSTSGESLEIYSGDTLIFSLLDIPSTVDSRSFLGVVSTDPITRIVFDEDDTGDDIGIADLRFGVMAVPEPASLLLLGSGLIGLIGIQRKRKS